MPILGCVPAGDLGPGLATDDEALGHEGDDEQARA